MKKDLLFGLSGKQSTILGVIVYIIGRFLITGAIIEVIAIWFFVGGLYRWNKEIKARKKP